MTETDPAPVYYLSYCCPFPCGPAHLVGFIDPDQARSHILMHQSDKAPTVKRWDLPVEVLEDFGVRFRPIQ